MDAINMGADVLEFYDQVGPGLTPHCPAVEVGVWTGRSLVHLAKILKDYQLPITVYGVDTFDGGPNATPAMRDLVKLHGGSLLDLVRERLLAAGADNVVPLPADSVLAAQCFDDGACGFVFLDSSHLYEPTKAEIQAWLPKVRVGGILAGHDYWDAPGVAKAVDELVPARRLYGGCWHMVKEKV